MSETLPIAANSIVWNENTILDQGKSFINQKNNELKIFGAFWNASVGNDFFNPSSKVTSKLFKVVAEDTRKEVKNLHDTVVSCLDKEMASNPESEKVQQLLKIYTVSDAALSYYTSVVDASFYPTYFNRSIRDSLDISAMATFSTGVVAAASFVAKEVTGFELSETLAYLPFKLSLVAGISAVAAHIINRAFSERNDYKIKELKSLFEKALNPDLAQV